MWHLFSGAFILAWGVYVHKGRAGSAGVDTLVGGGVTGWEWNMKSKTETR